MTKPQLLTVVLFVLAAVLAIGEILLGGHTAEDTFGQDQPRPGPPRSPPVAPKGNRPRENPQAV